MPRARRSRTSPARKYAVLRYDAFDRHVDEQETSDGDVIFDQRTVYDGSNLLEVLDGSNNVTERYLNGPAVNQVLAVEEVGGDNPGVNWLLQDAQQSVRDVVRATLGDSSVVSAAAVDHVIYDAYGNQPVPQSATDPQEQTRIGFRGMMNDPLAGFDSTAGSDGSFPTTSAMGLNYSVAQGFYDSVSETYVTGAPGYQSGAVNPYEYSSDDPTVNGFVPVSQPMNSASAVGTQSGGGTPEYADETFAALEFGATSGSIAELVVLAYGQADPSESGTFGRVREKGREGGRQRRRLPASHRRADTTAATAERGRAPDTYRTCHRSARSRSSQRHRNAARSALAG